MKSSLDFSVGEILLISLLLGLLGLVVYSAMLKRRRSPSRFSGTENDIGHDVAFFGGTIPVIGVIASLVDLYKGRRRRAFQAIAVPVTNVVVSLALLATAGLLPDDPGLRGGTVGLARGVAYFSVPFLALLVLRRLDWPAKVGENRNP